MSDKLGLGERLLRVVIPTRLQVLLAVFLAMVVLVVANTTNVLHRLGLNDSDLQSSQGLIKDRFSVISHSLLASNIALVAFWSIVGLVAYLVCWAGYNLIIEARNAVTLQTQYENLGSKRGPWGTLVIKTICGLGLVASLIGFKYGLALSFSLVQPVIDQVLIGTVLAAIAGILVLALDFYVVFVFIELLLTGWHHIEAFTDV